MLEDEELVEEDEEAVAEVVEVVAVLVVVVEVVPCSASAYAENPLSSSETYLPGALRVTFAFSSHPLSQFPVAKL